MFHSFYNHMKHEVDYMIYWRGPVAPRTHDEKECQCHAHLGLPPVFNTRHNSTWLANECRRRRSHLSCVDRVAWMVSMGNQQQCRIITATAALFLAVCGILLLVVPTEDVKETPEFMVIIFFSFVTHTGYKPERGEGNIAHCRDVTLSAL